MTSCLRCGFASCSCLGGYCKLEACEMCRPIQVFRTLTKKEKVAVQEIISNPRWKKSMVEVTRRIRSGKKL